MGHKPELHPADLGSDGDQDQAQLVGGTAGTSPWLPGPLPPPSTGCYCPTMQQGLTAQGIQTTETQALSRSAAYADTHSECCSVGKPLSSKQASFSLFQLCAQHNTCCFSLCLTQLLPTAWCLPEGAGSQATLRLVPCVGSELLAPPLCPAWEVAPWACFLQGPVPAGSAAGGAEGQRGRLSCFSALYFLAAPRPRREQMASRAG